MRWRLRSTARGTEATAVTALPHPVTQSFSLFLAASLGDAALNLYLYFRPTPMGTPFALDPFSYVVRAVLYSAWTYALAALPFSLWTVWAARRGRACRGILRAQAAVAAVLLLVAAVDRECQRFMSMHASATWLATYGTFGGLPAAIGDALRSDRGGSWSSLHGVVLSLVFAPAGLALARRVRYHRRLWTPAFGVALIAAMSAIPAFSWNSPAGQLRKDKIRPALLLLWRELHAAPRESIAPEQLAADVRAFQTRWRAEDATRCWAFADPAYPLRKRCVDPPPAASRPPNIIVLVLETFRAKDMRCLNPDLAGPAPTPFLDALAQAPDSASYVRFYASGMPTVFAFMSIHAGLLQHPRKSIALEAAHVQIEGIPDVLRRHGYRTLHFTATDPDWDNQRIWLQRWYDEVYFDPSDREKDRPTFRRAARRLRELGRAGRPFFACLTSISNHLPFHSPEPQLDLAPATTTIGALHNTMRYTDDVVREFYTALRDTPWFSNTIWIVLGDHAYDLGDRGEPGGHYNLRHETTWVPLILHGSDPRLPRGRQTGVASQVDIPPTVAELAGVWDDNSYLGHSLLRQDPEQATAVIIRSGHYAVETAAYSLYKAPDAPPLVYAGSDLVQINALTEYPVEFAEQADALARLRGFGGKCSHKYLQINIGIRKVFTTSDYLATSPFAVMRGGG